MKRNGVAIVCLIVFLTGGVLALFKWKIVNTKQKAILLHSFSVQLPDGDKLIYKDRVLERQVLGPADSEKVLIWNRKGGRSCEYSISSIGAGYGDIEFRMRHDEKGVWLIDWGNRKVRATLDLTTTRFNTDGCVMYWDDKGCSDSEVSDKPEWATLDGGKSLGRKRF